MWGAPPRPIRLPATPPTPRVSFTAGPAHTGGPGPGDHAAGHDGPAASAQPTTEPGTEPGAGNLVHVTAGSGHLSHPAPGHQSRPVTPRVPSSTPPVTPPPAASAVAG